MTTPTQAQIEAAAKAIRLRDSTDEFANARAALTAAAQVGEPDDLQVMMDSYSEISRIVGRKGTEAHSLADDVRNLKAATIERCAQVIVRLIENSTPRERGRLEDALSAIRKLKEVGE